ncbi:7-carboxy-7-deazaguanine synthase QueE [Pseudonocardia sp. C8]|uniref:7-carboxy-7-deazaguanine synthase n=1 Tax=Saccharopolyspora cebuensis TaxID=418759 RepID=A0ABV4CSZ1_9PSEU|nr:7-carboxy-7-deazaguanine synthase QueE [Pseudonocardia sp. C8]MBC3194030.1 7-carboxy-7-deazaguanine synthase QueE [Pseudonocardia sp. C8]
MTALTDPIARPLLVSERFGPTVQGEGSSTGRQALFIRLSRCNLSCPGCDTPYTWDWSRFDPSRESQKMTADDLYSWVTAQSVDLVVISGGEPLLQQESLSPLVRSLAAAGRRIEIETNGTIVPIPAILHSVSQFNVSPKTAAFAGRTVSRSTRINPEAIRTLASSGKSIFKFVAAHESDLEEISHYAQEFDLSPIWVMPEGTTRERVLSRMSWLADEAIQRNWNLSTRLHILLWGDERGR